MEIIFTNIKNITKEQEKDIACHCSNRTRSVFRSSYLYSKYYSPIDYYMAIMYDNDVMVGWAALGMDVRHNKLSIQSYVKQRYRKKGYSTLLIKEILTYKKIRKSRKIGCYSPVIIKSLNKLNYSGYLFG